MVYPQFQRWELFLALDTSSHAYQIIGAEKFRSVKFFSGDNSMPRAAVQLQESQRSMIDPPVAKGGSGSPGLAFLVCYRPVMFAVKDPLQSFQEA